MDLRSRVNEVLGWSLLLGLAFYAADASCATAECHLACPPQPVCQVELAQAESPGADPKAMEALFDTSKVKGEAAVQADQESPTAVPSARAEFLLAATMADQQGRGIALVSLGGQPPEVFATGQSVAGWELTQVTHQAVELSKAGKSYRLEFMQPAQLEVPAAASTPQEVAASPVEGPAHVEPIRTRTEIRDFLDGKNPEAQGYGSLRPYLQNGETQGYRVRVKDPRFPLARLGLQNNDIVTSVNGVPCTGPEGLSAIYRILRNDLNIRLELLREGKPETLNVTLEE